MPVSKATIDAIRSEITKYRHHPQNVQVTYFDLNTLWLAVKSREFFNEVNFLDRLLTFPPEQIPNEFKARCAERQSNPDVYISFADHPNTDTNCLYLAIAKLLFNPSDLKTLLEILMPLTKRCIRADLSYQTSQHLPTSERALFHLHEATPIEEGTLDLLAGIPITDQALSECIFFDDAVYPFQSNPSTQLSLKLHIKLYLGLAVYPALRAKLYIHNQAFQTLGLHIQQVKEGLFTPREMLKILIIGLNEGASKLTGDNDAGSSATHAIARFFESYNTLPPDVRAALDALPTQDNTAPTLADRLAIMHNPKTTLLTCVEVGADILQRTLTLNTKNQQLDYRPALSQQTLDDFNTYYLKTTLDTLRDTEHLKTFPFALLSNAFRQLSIESGEVLYLMLKDIPPEMIAPLFQHMEIPKDKRRDVFDSLAFCCERSLFTEAQLMALFSLSLDDCFARFSGYARLNNFEGAIFKALPKAARHATLTNNLTYARYKRYVTIRDQRGMMDYSAPEAPADLFATLPLAFRLEITIDEKLSSPQFKHQNPIPDLTPELFREVLFDTRNGPSLLVRIITDETRAKVRFEELLKIARQHCVTLECFIDDNNKNIIHYICDHENHNGDSLLAVFKHYFLANLYYLTKQADHEGRFLIDDAKTLPVFYYLLRECPTEKQLSLFTDDTGTFCPPAAFHNLDLLTACEHLADTVKIAFLGLKTASGSLVIHEMLQIAQNASTPLARLLQLLSDEQLTRQDELINLVLREPNPSEALATLFTLFRMELTYPTYFVTPENNGISLLAFYHKHQITISPGLYYQAICAACGNTPSLENTAFIVGLLQAYFCVLPATRTMKDILPLIAPLLTQCYFPTRNGGVIFNPTLLLLLHDLSCQPTEKQELGAVLVSLDDPINAVISLRELMLQTVEYLPDELLVSLGLTTRLINALTTADHNPCPNQFTQQLPAPYPTVFRPVYTKQQYHTLDFSQYRHLLNTYFQLLQFAEDHQHDLPALETHFYQFLLKTRATQRLIILNLRPRGVVNSLNDLFGVIIRPILAGFYREGYGKNFNACQFEEYLQFANIDWCDLTERLLANDATAHLEYLHLTRPEQLRNYHTQHNLFLRADNSLRNISTQALAYLYQHNFTIVNASVMPSSAVLTLALQTIVRRYNHHSNLQMYLSMIDMLIDAGANPNPYDENTNVPLLFEALPLGIINTLRSRGADINSVTPTGETILSYQFRREFTFMKDRLEMIHQLLRLGLSQDIINRIYIINGQRVTLLSYLYSQYTKPYLESMTDQVKIASIFEAAINAGADPIFFMGKTCLYLVLKKVLPIGHAVRSHEIRYHVRQDDHARLVTLITTVQEAINHYRSTLYSASAAGFFRANQESFVTYDTNNKINLLTSILQMCEGVYSLQPLEEKVKSVIDILMDSEREGIITVKRQPSLNTHSHLFKLINSLYGHPNQYSPVIYCALKAKPTLLHYFVGAIPTPLVLSCIESQKDFLKKCHPDQYASFNFYAIINSFSLNMPGRAAFFGDTLRSLSEEQLMAMFTQFFHGARECHGALTGDFNNIRQHLPNKTVKSCFRQSLEKCRNEEQPSAKLKP